MCSSNKKRRPQRTSNPEPSSPLLNGPRRLTHVTLLRVAPLLFANDEGEHELVQYRLQGGVELDAQPPRSRGVVRRMCFSDAVLRRVVDKLQKARRGGAQGSHMGKEGEHPGRSPRRSTVLLTFNEPTTFCRVRHTYTFPSGACSFRALKVRRNTSAPRRTKDDADGVAPTQTTTSSGASNR